MHQTHRNSSIPVSAPNEFPPDPGEKLNWKTSIAEESDEDESDDQSYSSDEGIIDGTRPPPNKADIVKELWRPRSRKQRKNKATKRRMKQGGQISDLRNNQVEVWNGRNSQEQAVHQRATSQRSDQVHSMIDISYEDEDERSNTSAEWQLNVSRLVGEVNDGIPPFFTPAETEFMLVEGAKHQVKYKPAPGARRKSKQQQRTARW